MKKKNELITEFLYESNLIEGVIGDEHIITARKAFNFANKVANELPYPPIGLDNVLRIHKLLMKDLRPDIAGKLRTCSIRIGRQRKIFTSIQLLEEQVGLWEEECKDFFLKFKKSAIDMSTVEQGLRDLHVSFENIHPFEDGNGRTGRIIYNAQRLYCGLPIHIIHTGPEQFEYYKWFRINDPIELDLEQLIKNNIF